MEKLFLQGEREIGKSTAIREAILPYLDKVAGFYVQKILVDGERIGFSLENLTPCSYNLYSEWDSLSSVWEQKKNVFIYKKEGRWEKNLEVFKQYAYENRCALDKKRIKLILLDEMGGVELMCEPFKNYLEELLMSNICCLGVIKYPKNKEHMANTVKGAKQGEDLYNAFYKKIINEYKVLTMHENNRDAVTREVKKFVQSIII